MREYRERKTETVIVSLPARMFETESWTPGDRRVMIWAFLKKLGMCRFCEKSIKAPSTAFCRHHAEQHRVQQQKGSAATYSRRRKDKVCVRCEDQVNPGRALCPRCAEDARLRAENKRKAAGVPPRIKHASPRERLKAWEAGLKERLSQGSHGAQKGTQEDLGKAALRDGWLSDGVAS